MNKVIGTVTILGPRVLHDWTKCKPEEIYACGWPAGMDGETANFLQAEMKTALTAAAASTHELVRRIDASSARTALWRQNYNNYRWRKEAIESACRFVDATEKWVLR
jgi:hypothetical protein